MTILCCQVAAYLEEALGCGPYVAAMQAHFNPNAAADSCAVLAVSFEMWVVICLVCAVALLLAERPRPQTQPQMG